MLSLMIAAAVAVPPPAPGDERTAILYTVNRLLELVGTGEGTKVDGLVDPRGRMIVIDSTKGAATPIERPMQALLDMKPNSVPEAESIGVPTVLQRGWLAQVWAPYTYWVGGKVSHCGIDNFTLVKRDGNWVVTDLSYTKEPPSACAELAAPERPR